MSAEDTNYQHDAFTKNLLAHVPPELESGARAFVNEDGDCIEILTSHESYYGERIDDLLTVYYGRSSGTVVGGLIKGLKKFIQHISECSPGFKAEFTGGNLSLEYLLTAALWTKGKDEMTVEVYMRLREIADAERLSVPMEFECA